MCVRIWLRVGAQRFKKVANHILGCDNFGEFAVEIDERHRVHPFGGQELPIDGLKVKAPGELRSPLLLRTPLQPSLRISCDRRRSTEVCSHCPSRAGLAIASTLDIWRSSLV